MEKTGSSPDESNPAKASLAGVTKIVEMTLNSHVEFSLSGMIKVGTLVCSALLVSVLLLPRYLLVVLMFVLLVILLVIQLASGVVGKMLSCTSAASSFFAPVDPGRKIDADKVERLKRRLAEVRSK